MIDPEPQTPGERPHRAKSDPLQMSVAEKLACEWEARHDVAARRRIADAAPVQHYLTHARCEDSRHATALHPPRSHAEHGTGQTTGSLGPLVRSWFRWGEDGR